MVNVKITPELEKTYILKNLHQFPMVVIGSAQAGVTPKEYIDRFFEVFEKEPQKILDAIKATE